MKTFAVAILVFLKLTATAQSPYLSIVLKMDSVRAALIRYKIEMKICKPKKMTARSDRFSHDTSKIDFASLKATDINCGEYFDKGIGESLTYDKDEISFNKFQFSAQVFAWEEIHVFRITNYSSRAWWPPMYIVMPMKYKSFITLITLNDIEFQSGKVIFLTDPNASYEETKLNIRQSMKDVPGVEVKNFPLKSLLEEK